MLSVKTLEFEPDTPNEQIDSSRFLRATRESFTKKQH